MCGKAPCTAMCRIKRPVQPHIRGKWRGKLPRPEYIWQPPYPPSNLDPTTTRATINLPFSYDKHGWNTKVTPSLDHAVLLLPTKGRSRKCRIIRLPMEILLQIAEYLVPTEASFHVFPSTWQSWGGIRSTIVHKFAAVASEEKDRVKPATRTLPRDHLTALAQTCRVLSKAYYATIYGCNHFIIELSAEVLKPTIEGPATSAVESWTKVLRSKRQGMWPLTEQSIPYVKHLTILGTLSWEIQEAGKTALKKHLLSAIALLEDAQQLQTLTVDMRCSPRSYDFVNVEQTSWQMPQMNKQAKFPPQDVDANRRLGWGVRGPQDTVLRLRDVITDDNFPGLVELWSLFEDLRGFRDVVLSGHIDAAMMRDLHAKMISKPELLQPVEAVKERRGAASKRKRVVKSLRPLDSLRPLKSRRRI